MTLNDDTLAQHQLLSNQAVAGIDAGAAHAASLQTSASEQASAGAAQATNISAPRWVLAHPSMPLCHPCTNKQKDKLLSRHWGAHHIIAMWF